MLTAADGLLLLQLALFFALAGAIAMAVAPRQRQPHRRGKRVLLVPAFLLLCALFALRSVIAVHRLTADHAPDGAAAGQAGDTASAAQAKVWYSTRLPPWAACAPSAPAPPAWGPAAAAAEAARSMAVTLSAWTSRLTCSRRWAWRGGEGWACVVWACEGRVGWEWAGPLGQPEPRQRWAWLLPFNRR